MNIWSSNVYIEKAKIEIKGKLKTGVQVHGEKISMLRSADDIAIITESKEVLIRILNCMEKTMKKYNLNINAKKTKIMECG
jgi:hypothetical protein